MFVYLNGRLVPAKKAKISVFDHGYLYGDGIFETMRAYNGKAFLEKQHLARMGSSARKLGIRFNAKQISGAIKRTLTKNKLANAYVRVSLSRGQGETGISSKCKMPTVLVIAKPLEIDKRIYHKGISCATFVQDYTNPLNSKSLSFLNYVLARRSSDADEVILVSPSGHVKEGSVSNVFLVKDKSVLTPPANNIVDGITRKALMQLCKEGGLPIQERKIRREELLSADECFVTNSLKGIVPVVRVDGRPIGRGKPGKITLLLTRGYTKLAGPI